jgi:hypothetical protein
MSASTSATRESSCCAAIATFSAVTVLPSPGAALVSMTDEPLRLARASSREATMW